MTVTNIRCHGDRGIVVTMLAVIVLTYAWGRRGRPWMATLVVFIITVDGSTGVGAFFCGILIRGIQHEIVNRA
jgi:membrane protease YdiL (CAAX protease family)